MGNLAEWFGPVKEKSKRRKFRSSWIGCGATNIQMRLYLIHLLKGDWRWASAASCNCRILISEKGPMFFPLTSCLNESHQKRSEHSRKTWRTLLSGWINFGLFCFGGLWFMFWMWMGFPVLAGLFLNMAKDPFFMLVPLYGPNGRLWPNGTFVGELAVEWNYSGVQQCSKLFPPFSFICLSSPKHAFSQWNTSPRKQACPSHLSSVSYLIANRVCFDRLKEVGILAKESIE